MWTSTNFSVLALRYGRKCETLKPKNSLEAYLKQKMTIDEISEIISSSQQQRLSTLDMLMGHEYAKMAM